MADKLDRLAAEFTISACQLRLIADKFRQAMADGLAGRPGPLKMLPSYLAKPAGTERGSYLALDFGGSNIRALLVELLGDGQWRIRQKTAAPLKDPRGLYDYTAANVDERRLFDFVAGRVERVAPAGASYPLGHTFSFPCRQHGLNRAVLISWTKEIKTAGVEGRDINGLLAAALERRGAGRIKPLAVINDTVGTLLAAAYGDRRADLASICGTGHNTCYYDAGQDMIINLESGNFDALPYTGYDRQLDGASEQSGAQRLEKMVAGRYLGELVRLIAADLLPQEPPPAGLTAEALGGLLNGADCACDPAAAEQNRLLRQIARLVVARSARLVAATFLGTLLYLDPRLANRHTIAIDGSLYEKMPGYAALIKAALTEALGARAGRLTLTLSKDGSGIGAAIAAALAARR